MGVLLETEANIVALRCQSEALAYVKFCIADSRWRSETKRLKLYGLRTQGAPGSGLRSLFNLRMQAWRIWKDAQDAKPRR